MAACELWSFGGRIAGLTDSAPSVQSEGRVRGRRQLRRPGLRPGNGGGFPRSDRVAPKWPRRELAQNVSDALGGAAPTELLDLGLLPFLLDDELLADLLSVARMHIDRLERSAQDPNVSWRSTSSNISRKTTPQAEDPPQNVSSEL